MKLKVLLEDEKNEDNVVAHLVWLDRTERKDLIVDPVPGYHETNNCRAYRIIGRYDKKYWWVVDIVNYIRQYFKDHPDMLERARNSLKNKYICIDFKDLFR